MVEPQSINNLNILSIPMNKEETDLVDKFKALIQKENLIYNSQVIDNNYLIRFLRARKLKIEKALDMFKKYIQWRDEIKVDDIFNDDFPEEADILSIYPQGLHKVDKEGRPIYYELLGKLNIDDLLKKTSFDRLLKYTIRNFEYYLSTAFPAASKSVGRNISQFFSIIDLKGFNKKLLSKKVYEHIKISTTSLQNYYPEILGMSFIINSNLVFKACWTVIKPFLDDKTKNKIHLIGSDYKKTLLKHISEENIPNFFGGSCKCTERGCLFSNAGPWNNGDEIKLKVPLDKLPTDEGEPNVENDEVIGDLADMQINNEENGNIQEES